MKKISLYISVLLSLVIFSCKKKDNLNPLADFKNLGIGSYITKKSDINLNMDYNTPGSKVGITVDQYVGGGEVAQVVLYVVQGASSDPTAWKKIKTVEFTGPGTEISATEQEVAAALGVEPIDLEPGSYCTFYNQVVTKDGRTFDLSNSQGALESDGHYNTVFRWTAYITCPFTGGMAGSYKVIQDDWADWSPGDVVQVTDGPGENQINISQVWPNPAYGDLKDPLLVNVDPANGVATIPLVTFADYGKLTTAEGDPAGYVFSCTGYIGLNISLVYGGASQGVLKLILQKN
jgi:hypothetical protein